MDWKTSLEALKATMPQVEEAQLEEVKENEHNDAAETARLDIMLDRKGRKGKEATIISGFTIGDEDVAAIAAKLKQKLGTGGSSRGGEILIQGDKRQQIHALLTAMGMKARII